LTGRCRTSPLSDTEGPKIHDSATRDDNGFKRKPQGYTLSKMETITLENETLASSPSEAPAATRAAVAVVPHARLTVSDVSLWQIVLKKSFLGDEQNFLGPLMRLASGDVRDHIFSHKTDHGPSYRRYGALLR
jgi:hypothetical protein